MPPSVRVIGRIDLAEQIREVARSAGFEADVVTAGPISVFGGAPPGDGVDVAMATSVFDPPLWRLGKSRHPLRPLVVMADRKHERALRRAMLRRYGPDAYVTWPATPEDLAAAIRRARSSASRTRSWTAADVGALLVLPGVLAANVGSGVGAWVAGVGLLLGVRSAWSVGWQTLGGVLLTLYGGIEVAGLLSRWLR